MVDKELMKVTLLNGIRDFTNKHQEAEGIFSQILGGRDQYYRMLFKYPKKWSKRKVKKVGRRDYIQTRIELALEHGLDKVCKLGDDYANFVKENFLE